MPWWRRPLSLAIALLVNILILLMLLNMTPTIFGTKNGQGTLTTFNLSNDDKKAQSQKHESQKQSSKAARTTPVRMPKPTVEPPKLPTSHLPSDFIPLTSEDFAAADVSKLPSHADAGKGSGSGSGESGDSAPAGSGPNGQPLYAAEWYRRPTDAEVSPYIAKANIPEGGWADIACRTAPRFHVEDCVALGDSPAGSHLARAIQDAAWQFLVRPPRVGGKSLVGGWVRIHYEITIVHKRADRSEP